MDKKKITYPVRARTVLVKSQISKIKETSKLYRDLLCNKTVIMQNILKLRTSERQLKSLVDSSRDGTHKILPSSTKGHKMHHFQHLYEKQFFSNM